MNILVHSASPLTVTMSRIPLAHRWLILAVLAASGREAWSLDILTVRHGQETRTVVGEVLVTAADGGVLLTDRDGVLWSLQPHELIERTSSEEAFQPSDPLEYARRLLADLPPGFRVRQTAHYVFLYDTSTAYAKWCGVLYERLYRAFYNFWSRQEVPLRDPRFPLVAIVFSNRQAFEDFGQDEVGAAVESIVGYYSMQTNRVVMYDLTGMEELRAISPPLGRSLSMQRILSQPAAISNVATIVHEATHQLAFNCGLQTRLADNPLWLSEGLAMFFETPDFRNEQGWRRVGGVHPLRLHDFRQSLPQRTSQSLAELVSQDDRLRDPETAGTAYAEAWALSYYLLKKRPEEFARYLTHLSATAPLQQSTSPERLALLAEHFGELSVLERDFLHFLSTIK